MDPTANLQEQLRLAAALVEIDPDTEDDLGLVNIAYDAQQLAELVLALSGWLSSGGFLPQQWQK